MRIKCLAQGNNILLPGFEPSASVSKTDILTNRPICLVAKLILSIMYRRRMINFAAWYMKSSKVICDFATTDFGGNTSNNFFVLYNFFFIVQQLATR